MSTILIYINKIMEPEGPDCQIDRLTLGNVDENDLSKLLNPIYKN